MKTIIDVKSNPVYLEEKIEGQFSLEGNVELVIIHSDGKEYQFKTTK